MPEISVPRNVGCQSSHIIKVKICDDGPAHSFSPGFGEGAAGIAGFQDKVEVTTHNTVLDWEVLMDVL